MTALALVPELTRDDTEVTSSGWQLPRWGSLAACRDADPDEYFPESGGGQLPKKVLARCGECPVRAACLEEALESPWMPYGPWGGLRQSEVQAMWLTRHPRDRSDDDTVLAFLGLA